MPEEDTVAEPEPQRTQVQDRLNENATIPPGENTLSTTAGASPTGAKIFLLEGRASSIGAGAPSSGEAATSSRVTTLISPEDSLPPSTGIAQDVPHHTISSSGAGAFAGGTYESAYDKNTPVQLLMRNASPAKPPEKCVDLDHIDRGPCRLSKDDYKVIKIPNGITGLSSRTSEQLHS